MPSYPCEACGAPVEIPTHDPDMRCKKCGDKQPFKCSKCQKRLSYDSIYHPERLTFRKPIFCKECGAEADYVTCNQCNLTLVRANSIEKKVKNETHFYHKECYEYATKMQKRAYLLVVILVPIFAYLCHLINNSTFMYVIGAAIGIYITKYISDKNAPK